MHADEGTNARYLGGKKPAKRAGQSPIAGEKPAKRAKEYSPWRKPWVTHPKDLGAPRGRQKNTLPKLARVWLVVLIVAFVATVAFGADHYSFPAKHDHWKGNCSGTLIISDEGVRYEAAEHNAKWAYPDIQEMSVLPSGRVTVLTYADAGRLRLGADREFNFEVTGDLKPAAVLLAARLDRRFVNGFGSRPETVIAEFAVKHLRVMGGDEGTLVFGEQAVSYRSEAKDQSRTWRYEDIESISTGGPYQLSLSTYERQPLHYATRREFNFQLKQPLNEKTYNRLWRKVSQASGLEVFEELRSEVERKAAEGQRRDAGNVESAGHEARDPEPQILWTSIADTKNPMEPQRTQRAQRQTPPAWRRTRVLNASAQRLCDLCALRGDSGFRGHISEMQRVLREEGLPANLAGVAKVESGFNPYALSPKNARGLWQFIPETARRFGLRVDGRVDERVDTEKSTRAAARYLKELYGTFGDWRLALAGYNAGEGRVQSAMAAAGTSDFTRLARLLPRETRNYVPAVLDALGGSPASMSGMPPSRGYRLFAPMSLLPSSNAE